MIYMVFTWYLHGIYMVFTWYLPGIYMVFTWYLPGIYHVKNCSSTTNYRPLKRILRVHRRPLKCHHEKIGSRNRLSTSPMDYNIYIYIYVLYKCVYIYIYYHISHNCPYSIEMANYLVICSLWFYICHVDNIIFYILYGEGSKTIIPIFTYISGKKHPFTSYFVGHLGYQGFDS